MPPPGTLIQIDGSQGEGGGGIVRTALALAALTQQSVRINSVRGNTAYPGIDVEDFLLAKVYAESTKGELPGIELGASSLTFLPGSRPQAWKGTLQTPLGERQPSAMVLLSALIPVLSLAGATSSLTVFGETYGANTLTYDYYSEVAKIPLQKMGIYTYPELLTASFGRRSPGEVQLEIEPSFVSGLQWETRGRFIEAKCIISTCRLDDGIAARGKSHLDRLASSMGLKFETDCIDLPGSDPGCFVTMLARYENGCGGATIIGSRGLRIENLVQRGLESLYDWMRTDATVDPNLPDLLLLTSAIAQGPSIFRTSRLTKRFLTSVAILKHFLPIHVTVRGSEDGPGTITTSA